MLAPLIAAQRGRVLLQGAFVGVDAFHFAEGLATFIEGSNGVLILTITDFSVLAGADLYLYLSPDPIISVAGQLPPYLSVNPERFHVRLRLALLARRG